MHEGFMYMEDIDHLSDNDQAVLDKLIALSAETSLQPFKVMAEFVVRTREESTEHSVGGVCDQGY